MKEVLQAERPDEGSAASKQIESVKHLLWDGNVQEALDRIDSLFMDLDLISGQSAPADKLAAGISGPADLHPEQPGIARRSWNQRSTKW